MFFHTLAFVIVVGTIFIIHKVRKATLSKQRVYTTVTTVAKKNNPHPLLLPEIVGEIQSYLDLVSLGKCRLINSEWSNIAAAKLKGRIHEFEDNHPCYRPTEEEIVQHLNDTQLAQFQNVKIKYISYQDDYKLRYHIEDLMLSNSKNKKILDFVPEQITNIFNLQFLRSEECPFLFKMRFRVLSNRNGTSLDFLGFAFHQDLPCPIGLKDVPDLFPGHIFEAVVDLHACRAYNIRVYSIPETILGLLPTGNQAKAFAFFFVVPMLLGDLWQIYYIHKVLEAILIFIMAYYFLFVIAANPPLRLGFFGAYIYGLALYRSVVVDILKLVAYMAVGYLAQRIVWEVYLGIATPKRGSRFMAGVFIFELIIINNLRVLWQSIITGNIFLAFLENNFIFGLCFLQYFLWAIVQKEFPKQAFGPVVLLRCYATVILYTFYNPTPWLFFGQ